PRTRAERQLRTRRPFPPKPRRSPPRPCPNYDEDNSTHPALRRRVGLCIQWRLLMTQITAAMVKELREQTGAGMMDVKRALTEAGGNMEEARTILRKKGLAAATKKAGRITSEGAVQAYTSGNVGVLVEINCETDFVARTDQVRQSADHLAK